MALKNANGVLEIINGVLTSECSASTKRQAVNAAIDRVRNAGDEKLAGILEKKMTNYNYQDGISQPIELSSYDLGNIPEWGKKFTEEEWDRMFLIANTAIDVLSKLSSSSDGSFPFSLRGKIADQLKFGSAGNGGLFVNSTSYDYILDFNPDDSDKMFERGKGFYLNIETTPKKHNSSAVHEEDEPTSYSDDFYFSYKDGRTYTTRRTMLAHGYNYSDHGIEKYVDGMLVEKEYLGESTYHFYTDEDKAIIDELGEMGVIDTTSTILEAAIEGNCAYTYIAQGEDRGTSVFQPRFCVAIGNEHNKEDLHVIISATINDHCAYISYNGEDVTVSAVQWVMKPDCLEHVDYKREDENYSDYLEAVGETDFGKRFNGLVEKIKEAGKNVTIHDGAQR